jgi:hypothetical protein
VWSFRKRFYSVVTSETATTLKARNRSIEAIPASITLLHLTHLDLGANLLTSVPPAVCTLLSLEVLCLDENLLRLEELPCALRGLTKLRHLALSHNRFYDKRVPVLFLRLAVPTLHLEQSGFHRWPLELSRSFASVDEYRAALQPHRAQHLREVCAYLHRACECDAALIEAIWHHYW